MFDKKTNQQPPEIEYGDMDQQVQAVMEKYDRESNVRHWTGIPRKVVRYLMVAFTVYCVLINFLFSWETRIERASFVGCIVFLVFLIFPARKGGGKKEHYIPWYDVVLALAGGFSFFSSSRMLSASSICIDVSVSVFGEKSLAVLMFSFS